MYLLSISRLTLESSAFSRHFEVSCWILCACYQYAGSRARTLSSLGISKLLVAGWRVPAINKRSTAGHSAFSQHFESSRLGVVYLLSISRVTPERSAFSRLFSSSLAAWAAINKQTHAVVLYVLSVPWRSLRVMGLLSISRLMPGQYLHSGVSGRVVREAAILVLSAR